MKEKDMQRMRLKAPNPAVIEAEQLKGVLFLSWSSVRNGYSSVTHICRAFTATGIATVIDDRGQAR